MPRINARFTAIRVSKSFTKELDEQLQIKVRKAARAWIAAVILQVPAWSGMTKGSIKFAQGPNGSLAAFLRVAVPITPVKGGERKDKNAAAGGPFGHYQFVAESPVYLFKFRSDVPHYLHHEFFARPAGVQQQIIAPWKSFRAGAAAFRETMHEEIATLPKISKFFLRVPVTRP